MYDLPESVYSCRHKRRQIDWNDLGSSTADHLKRVQTQMPTARAVYANPRDCVASEAMDRDFFTAARRCQNSWFRFLDRTYPSWRVLYRQSRDRVQEYRGVMLINGAYREPAEWRDYERKFRDGVCLDVALSPNRIAELVGTRDGGTLREEFLQEIRDIMERETCEAIYADPLTAVFSEEVTPAFLKESWKATGNWHHQRCGFLKRAGLRRKDRLGLGWSSPPVIFNGVMVIKGVKSAIGCWKSRGRELPGLHGLPDEHVAGELRNPSSR